MRPRIAGTAWWIGLLALPALAGAQPAGIKSLWHSAAGHAFQSSLDEGLGFSFTLGGERFGPSLPPGWRASGTPEETIYHGPSGFTVIRQSRAFPELQAVEYTLRFRNGGSATAPALTNVHAMDLTFTGDLIHGLSAVTCGGGGADATYPPRDFAITRKYFGPMMPVSGRLALSATDGNPSRTNLPMFFLENQSRAAGIFVSIGWTGQWEAGIAADVAAGAVHLQGGMADLDLKLNSGEEISGPTILLGAYNGPLSSGSNRLRRLIRDRYAPRVAGKPLVAPMLYTGWFDIGLELDGALFRRLTDRAAELGQEVMLMDAGWYKGVEAWPYTDMAQTWRNLSNPLGNWELGEERSRFPSGLPALADYVRSKGMQFGLWFEPERAGPQSLIAREHPEWMIRIPTRPWLLVNFGAPGVADYFCRILDRYVEEDGIRYLRWDQNNEPLAYWRAQDPPGRRGITEIRHIEGVHRVEDYIRRRHPEVILESCAGGGRRIDLQTLERRQTIWISDQTMDPLIVRFHLEGLNLFLPGNAQLVAFSPPTETYRKPGFQFPDLAFQSFFGGAFGLAGRLTEWPPALREQARRQFQAYKRIRGFLAEDYYALAPQPSTLESWSGWQFHDPATGEGFVQAFRLRSPEASRKLVLHALDARTDYRFTDLYSDQSFELPAAQLVSEGLRFDLPPMSSRVLLYRPVKRRN